MSNPDCCRSFCDGCPWAEEQKLKLLGDDSQDCAKEDSQEKAS